MKPLWVTSASAWMSNAVEKGADVTGNCCGFDGDPLAVDDQPAIEGEEALGGFHTNER